jgi:hypothetical protein
MVKGKVGGAVTPPRCPFAIQSVLPILESGSQASVNGRCTPRIAAAKDSDVCSHYPIVHCACGRLHGVKPKPPAAVASRGLTPVSRPKRGSGSDSGTHRVHRLAAASDAVATLACENSGSNGVCRSSRTQARPSNRSATPRSARPCDLPRRRSAAYLARHFGSCWVATRAQ